MSPKLEWFNNIYMEHFLKSQPLTSLPTIKEVLKLDNKVKKFSTFMAKFKFKISLKLNNNNNQTVQKLRRPSLLSQEQFSAS